MERAYEKLIRYAAIDTQSDPESNSTPSTAKQFDLLRLLEKEMKEMGLVEITLDENGYLFGTLPANTDQNVPVIGFLAHVDTSPDFPGQATNTRLVRYEGGDLALGHGRVLTEDIFPLLPTLVGEELLVADGSTLLGADDKAGISEILTAMEHLIAHPEIKHGKIRVGFTPDEEIGRGPHHFDVAAFGADLAYTIDGSTLGEFSVESFNAASAEIEIRGESIHPGSAKGKMINSQLLAMELHSLLPVNARPEYTEGRDGFYMLSHIEGEISRTTMSYIIRDHDRSAFEAKKEFMEKAVAFLNEKYGDRITLTLDDSYYNMADVLKDYPELTENALAAYRSVGVEPDISPIRGGTDGSQLSYMGLPAPNIFVGGYGFHGPYEVAVPAWMDKASAIIVEIARRFAENKDLQ